MNIIDYTYRKPSYIEHLRISPNLIDTINIHHTGNYNSIDTNTNYHINDNKWAWLGYGWYIVRGLIYKVRGMEYQNAAVKGHNHHTVNIAIEGNYDIHHIADVDKKALEWLIGYLKKENNNIKYVKGHRNFNETSCPGKNINTNEFIKFLDLKDDKYDILLEENESLKKEVQSHIESIYVINAENKQLHRILDKYKNDLSELKLIYRDKVKELQDLRAKN